MMVGLKGQTTRVAWRWGAVIILLLALRLPSLVQPAGGDQGLYGYAGQRILAGDVMYRDVWDQKPPAVALLYAAAVASSGRVRQSFPPPILRRPLSSHGC